MTGKFYNALLVMILGLVLIPSVAHAVCSNNEDGAPGTSGEIEFFTPENVLRYCDGTDWVDMVDLNEYYAKAVQFDGVNDSLGAAASTAFTSNSKQVTASFWLNYTELGSNDLIANNAGNGLRIRRNNGTESISINGQNASSTNILSITTNDRSAPENQWIHVLISIDMSDTGKRHVYINDIDEFEAAPVYTDEEINLSNIFVVGGRSASTITNSAFADVWLSDEYIDLSIEANRRKFIDANGHPVDLGATGQLPTGSSPDIFLSGDVDTWHTNKGTGGGFTENGALTDGGYVPKTTLNSGLVGHWKLDETSGTTAVDSSGNGNNGTYAGLVGNYTLGIVAPVNTGYDTRGPADDSAGHVNVPGVFPTGTNPPFSIATWLRRSGFSRSILKVTPSGNPTSSGQIRITGEQVDIQITGFGAGANDNNIIPNETYQEWYHLAITYDGANIRSYENGELQVTLPRTFTLTATDLRFGGISAGTGDGGSDFDDFRLYNRPLTPSEIEILAACTGPGSYYYNFTDDVMQWCGDVVSPFNMHTPASGSGGCTTPTASQGALNYDTDRFKACDGGGWLDVGK